MTSQEADIVDSESAISVWQALNEPVLEVSLSFARNTMIVAGVLLLVAVVSPYWQSFHGSGSTDGYQISFDYSSGVVAGASANVYSEENSMSDQAQEISGMTLNDFNYELSYTSDQVISAFGNAGKEVLDLSSDLESVLAIYQPGVSVVLGPFWDSWIDLMADPS